MYTGYVPPNNHLQSKKSLLKITLFIIEVVFHHHHIWMLFITLQNLSLAALFFVSLYLDYVLCAGPGWPDGRLKMSSLWCW